MPTANSADERKGESEWPVGRRPFRCTWPAVNPGSSSIRSFRQGKSARINPGQKNAAFNKFEDLRVFRASSCCAHRASSLHVARSLGPGEHAARALGEIDRLMPV